MRLGSRVAIHLEDLILLNPLVLVTAVVPPRAVSDSHHVRKYMFSSHHIQSLPMARLILSRLERKAEILERRFT